MRTWGALCLFAALLAGCNIGKGDDEAALGWPDAPRLQASPLNLIPDVTPLTTCDQVEAALEQRLSDESDHLIDQQLHWLDQPYVIADAAAEKTPSSGPPSPAAAPAEHSTTTTQVEGVEEADIVKTDGTHIYKIGAGAVHILQSWPAAELKELAEQPITGHPLSLLLDDKSRLIVLSSTADYQGTTVTVVDVSTPEKPQVAGTYTLNGWLLSSRRVAGKVMLVANSQVAMPPGVKTWSDDPGFWRASKADRRAWFEAQRAANRAAIRARTMHDWLATFGLPDDEAQCARFQVPNTWSSLGMTRIGMLDLDKGALSETLLLAGGGQIYATTSTLYVATPYYWWDDNSHDEDFTFVHAFDIAGDAPKYTGSGGVEGTPPSQYAFDEWQGALRVATSVRHRTGRWTWASASRVSVLAPRDGKLALTGQTPDLAPGETLYATRFLGGRGYVVTFTQRRGDPLFVLDLSDAANPHVAGELHVEGYSSYLQPLEGDKLLAVGQSGDSATGRVSGIKIALYDVANPAAPAEVNHLDLPWNAWSQALWDPKAFTYFPARHALGIPLSGSLVRPDGVWEGHSELHLYSVADGGVAEAGNLDMSDVRLPQQSAYSWWAQGAQVERAVFADDFVYAVSDLGVRAAAMTDLAKPLATVAFAERAPDWGYGPRGGL